MDEVHDHYEKQRDLDAAGLYQMLAEECRRAGPPEEKERRLLRRLAGRLKLSSKTVERVEARAEAKRREGALGKKRPFHRRQLYARVLRYAYWNGDPPVETGVILAHLRDEIGYSDLDHDVTMEKLVDIGWAPPRLASPLVPDSGELRMMAALQAAKASLAAERYRRSSHEARQVCLLQRPSRSRLRRHLHRHRSLPQYYPPGSPSSRKCLLRDPR